MELEKNGVREKSFLGVLVFGVHITRAVTAFSLTLSTKILVHFIVI